MNVLDLLKGKKMKVMTDMKVEVELEIEEVVQDSYTRQITPDTPENDWWGETETTHFYIVKFTNGSTKRYDSISQIKIEE